MRFCYRLLALLLVLAGTNLLSAEELPGWGEITDPVGNCPVDFVESGVSLSIPAGLHDMNPRLQVTNAPRVMQTVEGDFLYEIRVSDFPRPQAKTGVDGHASYVAAGILVWQDDRNILRWTRTGSGEANAVFLSCEQYEQGQLIGGGNFPMEDKPITLRVERRKDRLILSATYDNSSWRKVLERRCSLQKELKVGLFGLNVTEKDIEYRFEAPYLLSSK
ncbi:hypothetical protein Pan97_43010 [Bremerella volcania]|uniref:DUF1349 domain-containing protein n=1 Tax=Bremerella volcania TaxID=2527984 RepID=A0A518CDE8_9BACT|nr:DUF1349 domain-containing protein [Bremerella volcania]QDU77238.1 hypothetical protein Pan97_43010 [Bremerella volcania]